MNVDFDFSDVDSFFDEGEWEVEKKMIDVGDEAVKYAEEHGDYQDHTLTLRTSNDYDVDKDGLTLKNEAEYASFVESKGFEVLSGAALYAEKRLKEEFEKMITPQDIGDILYRDTEALGVTERHVVFEGDDGESNDFPHINPEKGLGNEMVIIHVKRQSTGKYWKKGFNEVNLLVPRIQGHSNRIRLNELERQANKLFDDVVNSYDGTTYRYSIESIGTEADTALKCHYVNVRILFEVLNVK